MKKLLAVYIIMLAVLFCGCGANSTERPAASAAKSGVAENAADSGEPTETALSLGESVVTDMVEFTLNGIEFQEYAPCRNGKKLYASDDNIFASLDLTIKNVSGEKMSVHYLLDAELDYNNGFIYNTRDNPSVLLDDDGDYYTFFSDGEGHGTGIKINMKPRTEYHYYLNIQCHKALGKDDSSPLKACFSLPSSSGWESFVYVIR